MTYTTVGHEPFSIHNILDQDVWQFTDNLTWIHGKHTFKMGTSLRHTLQNGYDYDGTQPDLRTRVQNGNTVPARARFLGSRSRSCESRERSRDGGCDGCGA